MTTLRILVADDHEVVRRGLVSLLTSRPGWTVCGEAQDGRQAVKMAEELKPHVVVIDIGMPNLNGLEATRQILRENRPVRVIVLTITDAETVARDVLDAGARGFLLKSDAARDLVAAVEAVQSGKTYFTSHVAEMVLEGFLDNNSSATKAALPLLTPREREIVQLLAEGKSSKEVATLLNLSVKTAETHRSNLMRKLNIHSLSELVLYAVKNKIVQVSPSGIAATIEVAPTDSLTPA